MRALTLASVAAAALVLSACGSATVDNSADNAADSAVPSSVAPLERNKDLDATTGESEPEGADSSESAAEPQPQDQGAQEIEEIPDAPPREEGEQELLDAMGEAGINVGGVEDQLITAARAACNQEDQVTVQAIAGQLIEQGRTELAIGEVVTLIEDTARTGYCQ